MDDEWALADGALPSRFKRPNLTTALKLSAVTEPRKYGDAEERLAAHYSIAEHLPNRFRMSPRISQLLLDFPKLHDSVGKALRLGGGQRRIRRRIRTGSAPIGAREIGNGGVKIIRNITPVVVILGIIRDMLGQQIPQGLSVPCIQANCVMPVRWVTVWEVKADQHSAMCLRMLQKQFAHFRFSLLASTWVNRPINDQSSVRIESACSNPNAVSPCLRSRRSAPIDEHIGIEKRVRESGNGRHLQQLWSAGFVDLVGFVGLIEFGNLVAAFDKFDIDLGATEGHPEGTVGRVQKFEGMRRSSITAQFAMDQRTLSTTTGCREPFQEAFLGEPPLAASACRTKSGLSAVPTGRNLVHAGTGTADRPLLD
jgi:hypothetical protein